MHDARSRKGVARLRVGVCGRHVGDEGYDDELQPDQRAGGRPDDDVEVIPFGEWCHTWNEPSVYSALNPARYYSSLTFPSRLVHAVSGDSPSVRRCGRSALRLPSGRGPHGSTMTLIASRSSIAR